MITTKKKVGTHALYEINKQLSANNLSLQKIGEAVESIFCILDESCHIKYINTAGKDWLMSSPLEELPLESIELNNYLEEAIISPEYLLPGVTTENPDEVEYGLQKVWFPAALDFKLCLVSKLYSENLNAQLVTILPIKEWPFLKERIHLLIEQELFVQYNADKYESLTKREREIVDLIAEGKNSREISDSLFISRHTVEQHRKNINKKLDVSSVAGLINYSHAFSSAV